MAREHSDVFTGPHRFLRGSFRKEAPSPRKDPATYGDDRGWDDGKR